MTISLSMAGAARRSRTFSASSTTSPAETIRTEQNYRSTSNILSAANALIENNNGRLGKKLWTDGADGEPISLYCAFNDLDEARFVVNRIKTRQENGGALEQCAILYRSNAQSRVLEEALLQASMPYRIYGGMRFERQEIKDALLPAPYRQPQRRRGVRASG